MPDNCPTTPEDRTAERYIEVIICTATHGGLNELGRMNVRVAQLGEVTSLVLAAPDLLAASEKASAYLHRRIVEQNERGRVQDMTPDNCTATAETLLVVDELDAAIAKAKPCPPSTT